MHKFIIMNSLIYPEQSPIHSFITPSSRLAHISWGYKASAILQDQNPTPTRSQDHIPQYIEELVPHPIDVPNLRLRVNWSSNDLPHGDHFRSESITPTKERTRQIPEVNQRVIPDPTHRKMRPCPETSDPKPYRPDQTTQPTLKQPPTLVEHGRKFHPFPWILLLYLTFHFLLISSTWSDTFRNVSINWFLIYLDWNDRTGNNSIHHQIHNDPHTRNWSIHNNDNDLWNKQTSVSTISHTLILYICHQLNHTNISLPDGYLTLARIWRRWRNPVRKNSWLQHSHELSGSSLIDDRDPHRKTTTTKYLETEWPRAQTEHSLKLPVFQRRPIKILTSPSLLKQMKLHDLLYAAAEKLLFREMINCPEMPWRQTFTAMVDSPFESMFTCFL